MHDAVKVFFLVVSALFPIVVVIRLSAFLLLCIGVQIVWNGIDSLLGQTVFHFRSAS